MLIDPFEALGLKDAPIITSNENVGFFRIIMIDDSVLVTAAKKSREDLLEEQRMLCIKIKKFSIEEMDELMYMATIKAEAKAEQRIIKED